MAKKASDSRTLEACLFCNLGKRHTSDPGYHARDTGAADCIDADEVGDLQVHKYVMSRSRKHGLEGELTAANLKSSASGSRSSSCSSAVASRTSSLRSDTSGGRCSGLSSAKDGVGSPWADNRSCN